MRRKRVLSGLGAAKKRRRKKAAKKPGKRVSRKAAQTSKGRLRKGCRYLKGDGARCCPKGYKKTAKRKAGKRKRTGAAKRARKGVAPRTPRMDVLNAWRRQFKARQSCGGKKEALANIFKQFKHMDSANPRTGAKRAKRWNRWMSEYHKKLAVASAFCKRPLRPASGASGGYQYSGRSPFPRATNGLKGHPCASPRPPAWCNK